MSFTGLSRGRRKAIATIRVTHSGGGSSSLIVDNGAPSPVTYDTGAWLEIVASAGQNINFIEIFDSTGETARMGTGAAASEVDLLQILPGGNGHLPVRIDSGTRIAIRPLITPTPNTETTINFYD